MAAKSLPRYRGKLQIVIEDLNLPNPVIRSHSGYGFIKQYVRDHLLLRTEPATNHVADYAAKKAVDPLPELRQKLSSIVDNDRDIQQDILETFLDRGQRRKLRQPTFLPNGKRIPGLKLDPPRQLALMQFLVRFCYLAAEGPFTTRELHPQTAAALGCSFTEYKLSSLRYGLWKLRAKGFVEKLPHFRRYRLLPDGYRLCLVYRKLFHKIYAPLTAGLREPFPDDAQLPPDRRTRLDTLDRAVADALDDLFEAVGLRAA